MIGAFRGLVVRLDGESVLFFEPRRMAGLPIFALPATLFGQSVLSAIAEEKARGDLGIPDREYRRTLRLRMADGATIFEEKTSIRLS